MRNTSEQAASHAETGGTSSTTQDTQRDSTSAVTMTSGVEIPFMGGRHVGTFFGFEGLVDPKEHVAIGLGAWRDAEIPLVRLHSECLTGDVFGSLRCDCGAQLAEAIERIDAQGGFLLYLRQEGRGIGLYNKLEAYRLQDTGMDTFEANRALGFDDDLREYTVAAQMLRALGRTRIRLLSNNPEKVRQLGENGIAVVERLGTAVHCNVHNRHYLASKVLAAGHHIDPADLGELL